MTFEIGIPGWNEKIPEYSEEILKNRITLIYGPPKVGKSVFCCQFAYQGLIQDEPCLYIPTDQGMRDLQQNMLDFGWIIQKYMDNGLFYVIDPISTLSGSQINTTTTYKLSQINNPTDLMVKVGLGTNYLYKKSNYFRAVYDSITTNLAFNPDTMVIRFLKAFIRRLKELDCSLVVSYTQGVASEESEQEIIALMDNTIHLDGKRLTINHEGMEISKEYYITNNGLVLGKKENQGAIP